LDSGGSRWGPGSGCWRHGNEILVCLKGVEGGTSIWITLCFTQKIRYMEFVFNVIRVHALIKHLHNKTNKRTNVKIVFLSTICYNSDMLRSILIIFNDMLNINKAYIKHRWIIKYIEICASNICRYYKNWSKRCGSCSFIGFYNSAHQEDVKFIVW
jgi:hypothetical protein